MQASSSENNQNDVPKYHEFMWPTLLALKELGNSGANQEIEEKTAEIMELSDKQQSELHGDGPKTKAAYRIAWARTYLKFGGAIHNTGKGIWTITSDGMAMTEDDVAKIPALVRAQYASRKRNTGSPDPEIEDTDAELIDVSGSERVLTSTDPEVWKDALLETLLELSPEQFERLCQRLLRESGFTRVRVTGRRGDGGIDGVGVLTVGLLSFHVFFQCKRYSGSVGSSAIRDFRGAMVGRTDKGLFITTGSFTAGARQEATRDGAPALDLIDGDALTSLLRTHQLGVATRQVEEVTVDPAWFRAI